MTPRRIELETVQGEAPAWLELWSGLVADHEERLAALLDQLPLATEQYRIFGRDVTSPRLVSWHGDPDAVYVYSGERHEPKPWTPGLRALRDTVQVVTGLRFNSVLANYYRHGQDGMGWHRDAEAEVGPTVEDRWIGSLSLGAPRRFVLRHRKRRNQRIELPLGEGALLVMRGSTQTYFQHAVPKTTRDVEPRMNLTFRYIVQQGSYSDGARA